MKTILLAVACLGLTALTSCKKDRSCTCNTTHTSPGGNVDTDLNEVTTYKEIRKTDAKTRCQNYTEVDVNANGGTSTTKGECKLN